MIEPTKRLSGNEVVKSDGIPLEEATTLDFWRWAFSDLKSNSIRGVFAEWLVARLLEIDEPVRDSWAAWDLTTPEGVRIEVKTSAYLQSWRQKKHSDITFDGLRSRIDDPDTGYAEQETYNADLYIFCVQIECDPDKWDALNLDQWRFYVLMKDDIEHTGCKRLGLGTIRKLADELDADSLRQRASTMIKQVAERRRPDLVEEGKDG